jgi:hypothetical protein
VWRHIAFKFSGYAREDQSQAYRVIWLSTVIMTNRSCYARLNAWFYKRGFPYMERIFRYDRFRKIIPPNPSSNSVAGSGIARKFGMPNPDAKLLRVPSGVNL